MNTEKFQIFGVCSICQQSGIELISEDTYTVLQDHDAYGKVCLGRYTPPEVIYKIKTA